MELGGNFFLYLLNAVALEVSAKPSLNSLWLQHQIQSERF